MNNILTVCTLFIKRQPTWVLISSSVGLLLCISGGVYLVRAYRTQTSQTTLKPISQVINTPDSATPSSVPTPILVPNLLNGLLVPAGSESTHSLAVMIENHPDARPQSGLGSASEVVEAIAEGGITRFMAIFENPSQAVRVGPIRSARPYYVSFAKEVQAIYAHAGGSKDALDILTSYPYNVDGLRVGAPVFTRDFSRKVSLEHTLYSSTNSLWTLATTTNRWPATVQYPSLLFADDALVTARPASQSISVSVSDPLYAVRWAYDPIQNQYLRSMAGMAHIDQNSGQQITAKTIVLQTVGRTPYVETYGDGVSKTVYNDDLINEGKAVILENGQAATGTWKVSNGRTRYYDTGGLEIPLVRGTLWIHLVHDDSAISY